MVTRASERERLERRIRLAATAGQVGLFEWDIAGGGIWCDEGTGQIFGRPDLVLAPSIEAWFDSVHPDDREWVAHQFRSLVDRSDDSPSTWRILRPDGEVRHVLVRSRVLANQDGRATHIVGAFIDVTELTPGSVIRHRLAAAGEPHHAGAGRFEVEARNDSLTGLPNRVAMQEWLSEALAAPRSSGEPIALCLVDLDRLRLVNDGLGHAQGDLVLVETAQRIRSLVRPVDLVFHTGSDEFAVVTEGIEAEEVRRVAERLLDGIHQPIRSSGSPLMMTASVGVCFTTGASTPEDLMRDASAALHRAKRTGNRVVTFDDELRTEAVHRVAVEADLHGAMERGDLVLHYQPFFDLGSGEVAGAEALLRWLHPSRGLVGPDEFIPIAEESDLILEIGEWVLDAACSEAEQRAGELGGPWGSVWVNASARQLEHGSFAGVVEAALGRSGLGRGRIGVEFTETALLSDSDAVARTLGELAELGVPIAIDDFGTGYSSLSRLAQYPVDQLKIDRSFVAALAPGGSDAMVAAIVEVGHAIGATVCAEGIESPDQLRVLAAVGVDQIAGFYLARPVPAAEATSAARAGVEQLAAVPR